MNTSRFCIASIVFEMKSATEINCFHQNRFRVFKTGKQNPDIAISFLEILPSNVEPNYGFLCNSKDLLRNYPFISHEETIRNNPILCSTELKDLLQSFFDNKEDVTLNIGDGSLTVTNFAKHRISIFYLPERKFNIKNGQIGCNLFSMFLHDFDALMIHSSCVDFDGKAAVFLAMDDGGKTTAAGLCEGGRILADDQVLFRKTDGQWLAYGTPWTTFPPDPGYAVPAAFFLLEKADEFSLKKLGSRELFSFLWGEHHKARLLILSIYQTLLFDLHSDLSSIAPVYLMRFPKDHIDQDAILKCMKQ